MILIIIHHIIIFIDLEFLIIDQLNSTLHFKSIINLLQ